MQGMETQTSRADASAGRGKLVAAGLVRVGAFVALAAGVIEVAYHFAAYRLWHAWLPASPQIVWMAPLANVVLVLPPTIMLALISARLPRMLPARVVAG